jgi:hypothetical protein
MVICKLPADIFFFAFVLHILPILVYEIKQNVQQIIECRKVISKRCQETIDIVGRRVANPAAMTRGVMIATDEIIAILEIVAIPEGEIRGICET